MPTKPAITVADHLKSAPAAARPILVAARKAITGAAPKAAEEIPYQSKPPKSPSAMYKLARYSVGGVDVVGFGTFSRHASIYFYRGRELEDPAGLLKGSGKDTRFVTLRSAADAERAAVKKLIREAFGLEVRTPAR